MDKRSRAWKLPIGPSACWAQWDERWRMMLYGMSFPQGFINLHLSCTLGSPAGRESADLWRARRWRESRACTWTSCPRLSHRSHNSAQKCTGCCTASGSRQRRSKWGWKAGWWGRWLRMPWLLNRSTAVSRSHGRSGCCVATETPHFAGLIWALHDTQQGSQPYWMAPSFKSKRPPLRLVEQISCRGSDLLL